MVECNLNASLADLSYDDKRYSSHCLVLEALKVTNLSSPSKKWNSSPPWNKAALTLLKPNPLVLPTAIPKQFQFRITNAVNHNNNAILRSWGRWKFLNMLSSCFSKRTIWKLYCCPGKGTKEEQRTVAKEK